MCAKWKLEGEDGFNPEGRYPIGDEYDDQAAAEQAGRDRFKELEQDQPSNQSGGQLGIQDRVFIVRPDGTDYRFFG